VIEKPRRRGFWIFALGFVVGVVALFGPGAIREPCGISDPAIRGYDNRTRRNS